MLGKHTTTYVICKRTGEMTASGLDNWFNSLNGGSRWDDYEVTLDKKEAEEVSQKYKKIAKIVERLANLEPGLAAQTADHILEELVV